MVPRWQIFGVFLRPVFSASRMQDDAAHFRPAFYIYTRATLCVQVW